MARKKPIPRSARKAINRGTLRSRGTDEVKNISVGLMDIDAAIMFYFNNVIKPTVVENDEVVKVIVRKYFVMNFLKNLKTLPKHLIYLILIL